MIILVLALFVFRTTQANDMVVSDSASCVMEQSLSNVVVKRERPHMKTSDNGCIVYDAKQISQYRPVTNAFDLLEEIPIIDVNKDHNLIEIAGTAKASIVINGHKSQMSREEMYTYLSSLPASQVKTIEIYNAAPPQFGTNGGVINLIMDQKRSEKVEANGSAWASLYQGTKFYHTGGISANIFKKKWMLNTSFSLGNLKETKVYTLYANHNVDGETHNIVNPTTRYTNNHAIKLTADFTYDLSKTRKINVTLLYRTDNPNYRFMSPLLIDNIQDSYNNGYYQSSKSTSALMASYESNGWKTGADLVLFHNNDEQDIFNDADYSSALNSKAKQKSTRGTIYFNKTHKVGKSKLSYGSELQWADVHNAFSNKWSEKIENKDVDRNNTQKESKWRTFCGWTHATKNIVATANITAEYFKSTRTQEGKTQTLWDKVTLEPNFNVNCKIDTKHSFLGSFGTSRTYPVYLNTSGRTAYYNKYYYIANSTKLSSYTSYTISAKLVTSNKYIVGCYSIIEPNAYIQFLYQDPHQLSAGQQFYNLTTYNRHGLLAVVPQSWSTNFESRLTAYLNYITSRGKVNDVSFDKKKFGTRIVLTNNIILDRKRTAALQINASYTSDILMGYSYNESIFVTSLAMTWKPKDTGWNIVLKCNDILNTSKLTRTTQHQLQSSRIEQLKDTRKVNLTVRYSLKGYKEKKIKEADTSRMGI